MAKVVATRYQIAVFRENFCGINCSGALLATDFCEV